MKVVIQDQTEALDPALRRYTEGRLGKLSRHFERVLEAEVHFAPQSRRGGETEEAAVKILIHPDGRKKPILTGAAAGRARRPRTEAAPSTRPSTWRSTRSTGRSSS